MITAIGVDPASYAALVASEQGFPAVSPALLTAPRGQGVIPVLASPQGAAYLAEQGGSAIAPEEGLPAMRVRVAGVLPSTPALPAGGAFFVVSLPAIASPATPLANEMLLTGTSIDMARLRAAVRATMRATDTPVVTTRSQALQQLAGAPLQAGTFSLFTMAIVVAAALALAVMLLELALGAADRELTLARLATMGLAEGQRAGSRHWRCSRRSPPAPSRPSRARSPCPGWWPPPLTCRCSRSPSPRSRCGQTSRHSWSRWRGSSSSPSWRWPARSGPRAGAAWRRRCGDETIRDEEAELTDPMAAASLEELRAEVSTGRHDDYGAGALIACDRLVRIYQAEGIEVQALQGLDLVVERGELTALVGVSGSGKSTLVNILAGLDAPTAGSVRVDGHDLAAMSARQRLAYRRHTVGFVWQQTSRNLLPYLTAAQNVDLPMRLAGAPARARRTRTAELLEVLSVAHCTRRRPDQMSGGEQQRVAIATAIANKPSLLLADEPTGELDSVTADSVFAALKTANTDLGVTVLIVTHDAEVSSKVRRVIAIRDGRTSTETLRRVDSGDGSAPGHAVEYAVLDRAGRLQLPREMTEALDMRDRVRLELEPDHIGVWPEADR